MMSDPQSETEVFGNYSSYYDLLYQDKNYDAETNYVISLINKYSTDTIELLELGCGTGNYSKHFAGAGYRVTGVEKSSPMIALATLKSIQNFIPVAGDITAFDLNKKFDAAISLFHVISYLNTNEELLSCFKSVSQHLKKNGLFIFDVWHTPAVYIKQPSNTIKRINTNNFDITRIAEPIIDYEENIVLVNYELIIKNKQTMQSEVFREVHSMRHFGMPEIKLIAQLSGFNVMNAEEFLTAKKPGEDTWGVCYTLQKND
jgi:SAM-dependent methyltransferase